MLLGKSHSDAFINGIAWNLLNVSIVTWLMTRSPRRPAVPQSA